jgi:hypothetical protein
MRKIAEARMKEVGIQPRRTAFAPNSSPIAGRAMLTDELMKGVRNEARVAITRMHRRSIGALREGREAFIYGLSRFRRENI